MSDQLNLLYSFAPKFFEPLRRNFSSPEALEYFMYNHGWVVSIPEIDFDKIIGSLTISQPLQIFFNEIESLAQSLSGENKELPDLEQIELLSKTAFDLTKALSQLELSDLSGFAKPLGEPALWSDIGAHLFDDLLVEFVHTYFSKTYLFLHLFGIIRYEVITINEDHRRPYKSTIVDWNQFLEFFKNPLNAFKKNYHWDDSTKDFEPQRLLSNLKNVLSSIGLVAQLSAPDKNLPIHIPADAGFRIDPEEEALRVLMHYSLSEKNFSIYELGMEIFPAIRATETKPSGLAIHPVLRGGVGEELSFGPDFKLKWQANVDGGNLLIGGLFPDFLKWTNSQLSENTSIELKSKTSEPLYLLGDSQSSHIKMSNVAIGFSTEGSTDDPEIKFHLKTAGQNGERGISAVISLESADGFVKGNVPKKAIDFSFDMDIVWSNKTGLSFNGGTSLDILLPLGFALGPLTLKNAHLVVSEGPVKSSIPSLALKFTTGIKGDFGPVSFLIDEMGLLLQLVAHSHQDILNLPPNEGPNFGNIDMDLGFKPPTRVGLKIDASAVQGGGFLGFDPDKGEYSGVIELTIKEKIALKAIGIITTKLPNGEEGYSLLVLISAEFTPIQLGFGFTLNGVGGLIAVHRGMDLVAIRKGVQKKTLDHILFPEDPLADAPQIIASLDSVFPIAEGNYSFGLMALIGWGVPTLLEVELGLLISFPSNDMAVVGTLSTTLPDKKTPLLILNVAFAGTLSFENSYLYFDARIDKSSRLLSFGLSGDMAVRVLWGDRPDFVLSVGGFHPDFEVPEKLGLEGMQRITLNLLADDNPRLLLKCYFALTPNTAQFGATIDFFFKKSKFKVVGFFYIHTLFQFSPFYFIIAMGATLDVKLGSKSILSVGVEGSLEGPTPWKAKGKGKFKIWWVKYSVSFSKTWGENKDTSLPDIAIFPQLEKALKDDRNWAALLPRHATLASLRELDDLKDTDVEEQDSLTLHPFASLSLIQRVVPLNMTIEKFGGQKPSDFKKFSLSFEMGGDELKTDIAKDFFAPAQFFALSKEQKISRKSYEKYPAGLTSDAGKLQANFERKKEVEYEFESLDSIEAPPAKGVAYEPATHMEHWASGSAIARSQLGKKMHLENLVAGKRITYSEEEFLIVSQNDLTPLADVGPASEFEIQKKLDELLQEQPQMQDQLIAVPAYEIL